MTTRSPTDPLPAKLTPKDRFVLIGAGGAVLLALGLLTPLGLLAGLMASGILAGFIWIYGGLAGAKYNHHERAGEAQLGNDSAHILDYRGEARLANSLHEALIIINVKQQIIFINRRAQDLFPQARTGAALTTILRDGNILAQIRNVIDGKPAEAALITLSAPVERFFRVAAAPLYGAATEFANPESAPKNQSARQRIVITLYDVTDLERANVVQADFLVNASHELKTPVASLLGYIETLRGHARNDPAAQRRFLAIMQAQAERMQRLIDDLLSLRRIEQTEHIAPTDIGDLTLAARAAIEALAPLALDRKVEITLDGASSLPVRGNQDELVQLVLNLIDNAVKMSPPGSNITITAKMSKDWKPDDAFSAPPLAYEAIRRRIVNPPAPGKDHAVLRIRDNGPGFAKEHMPRIGERFYRIAGDRPGSSRGTGLGLAIVKHITLRHRGGLMAESAPGTGTEFTLILPATDEASSEAAR